MKTLTAWCVAAALLGACLPAVAQRGRQLGLPMPGVPDSLGVNIHFTDERPGELDQLAAAGFHWIRMDFAWEGIEQTKGVYNFAAFERLMAALEKRSIRAIFILDYGNALYGEGSPRTPEARAAFARFAGAAVAHFKGRGILWEMWNEPNIGFWKPKPNVDEYIALASEVGKAIHDAAPGEIYIGPAVSGMDFTFMEHCFQAGLLKYWNAVSFHPYRETTPETAAPDFARLKEMVARYAPTRKRIPLLSGEWGYTDIAGGFDKERQGKILAREFLSNMASGLRISIWYDWHDDGLDPKDGEAHFGTVTNDYLPKPAYIAAQTLSRSLANCRFQRSLPTADASDHLLSFAPARGGVVRYAAWTTGASPHELRVPVKHGEFEIINWTGERTPALVHDGEITLMLSDAPQYIVPSASKR